MEYIAFAILGRVTASKQTTDGVTYGDGVATSPMTYTYNLSGAMVEQQYPSGRVVKNTLDSNGDLAQVQSRTANDTFKNYANSFVYNAAGAVAAMRLGSGRWENTQFNERLQPTMIGLGSGATSQNLLKLDYTYNSSGNHDNNGNILSQTITVPTVGQSTGFVATQTYIYDSLNRISQAAETIPSQTGWQQTFIYDRYGNRRFDTANTDTLAPGCLEAVCNPQVDAATNKLVGYAFDYSGNTTTDATGQTFIYDAENKQVQVNDANGIVGQYFYDGDGKRIKKVVPDTGETTIFVYDAGGKSIAEYSTIVALPTEAKVSYLTNDHLGSPRITTDELGQIVSRRDFMPFGEEIYRPNYGADSVRQKFTGYERDSETDLDFAQARYFNSSFGRFSIPDPLFIEESRYDSPQDWNLYSYARNSPTKYVDSDGLQANVKCQMKGKNEIAQCENEVARNINNREGKKFDVIVKSGRLEVIGKVDEKGLSKGELALYNAIKETGPFAAKMTLNVVGSSDEVTFGRSDKAGQNTIDLSDIKQLNGTGNLQLSGEAIAHEIVEGFENAFATLEDLNTDWQSTQSFINSHKKANEAFGNVTVTTNPAPEGSMGTGRVATYNFQRLNVQVDVTKTFKTKQPLSSINGGNFQNIRGKITRIATKPK